MKRDRLFIFLPSMFMRKCLSPVFSCQWPSVSGARLGWQARPQPAGLFERAAAGAPAFASLRRDESRTTAVRLQPEGLPEISRGLSESESDTPGQQSQNELHPGGMQGFWCLLVSFWHPFRVLGSCFHSTGGVSPAQNRGFNPRLISGTPSACVIALALHALFVAVARTETVSIVIASNAAPRVEFGAGKLVEALKHAGYDAAITRSLTTDGRKIAVGRQDETGVWRAVKNRKFALNSLNLKPEHFFFMDVAESNLVVVGGDDSGVFYGCLEVARQIRDSGKLAEAVFVSDGPKFKLRGTCVGMQKTYMLPGRKIYEYPYTPELFPWFYDRALWREYLDFLVANRMNTLYLWNGHPFSSLVKLKDYPEAIEVPEDVFQRNVEMFRWLTTECDRRGIWLVQMFYNIFLPKPLAEKHGVPTQIGKSTPLAADYTRKSIAEFVKQYPNVGLMVCLGEALQGTTNQVAWATNTILPGIHDGMRAAGLRAEPPVVFRTHSIEPEVILPACFQVYSNLFTESKYNGESLTTYEPRGKAQATHLAMAKLGPHLVNVHILANLEPFRYGAQSFIKKCVQASRDRLGASGIHLYPLSYWNWPYSPDIANPPLKQWERDWIWFEAWARYAWNPDVPEAEDRAYWIGRLAERYGNTNAAALILDAYNAAGEVAPRLIRRFGLTEGNRQTLSLGMTLDQLVNPNKYQPWEDLWLSQAPPGERLDEYVRKEWNKEKHVGETPESIINELEMFADGAEGNIESAAPLVNKNHDEFERLRNDVHCIGRMKSSYSQKVRAAIAVLRFEHSKDIANLESAQRSLKCSLDFFKMLTERTKNTYRFANSLQIAYRAIPFVGATNGVPVNYHWTQGLPLYEKELEDFRAKVAELKKQ